MYRSGEIEKLTTDLVGEIREKTYHDLKNRYLKTHRGLVENLMAECQVLYEMRQRGEHYLRRLASETHQSVDRLRQMADTWGVFQQKMAERADLAAEFFVIPAQTVKSIESAYRGQDEIILAASRVAQEAIVKIDPLTTGPRAFASSLAFYFGLMEPGARRFQGFELLLARSTVDEIAEQLHPLVRPLFAIFAEEYAQQQKKFSSPPSAAGAAASLAGAGFLSPIQPVGKPMLSLTIQIDSVPKDFNLDTVGDLLVRSLKRRKVTSTVIRSKLTVKPERRPPKPLKSLVRKTKPRSNKKQPPRQ